MDGFSLESAVKRDPLYSPKTFIGIFSQNTIPELRPGISFFFNTALSSDVLGEHWCYGHTFRIEKGKGKEKRFFELLDPLGSKLEDYPHLKSRVDSYSKYSYAFGHCIQSSESHACGPISLFFYFNAVRGIFGAEILRKYFSPALPLDKRYISDIFCILVTKTIYKLET